MPAAKPQEISVEIDAQLRQMALNAGSYASVHRHLQSILSDCDKLAKVNAVNASVFKANAYALIGDREQCEYWLNNASRIGGVEVAASARLTFLILMGFISEAYEVASQSDDSQFMAEEELNQFVSCGMARKAKSILDKSKLDVTPLLRANITKSVELLDALNLADAQICSVMDVTLRYLSSKRLIWLGVMPDFRFLNNEQGGPLLSMTFQLAVTPEVAANMNAELVDLLVLADLDLLGLIVGLQGHAQEPSALTRILASAAH